MPKTGLTKACFCARFALHSNGGNHELRAKPPQLKTEVTPRFKFDLNSQRLFQRFVIEPDNVDFFPIIRRFNACHGHAHLTRKIDHRLGRVTIRRNIYVFKIDMMIF